MRKGRRYRGTLVPVAPPHVVLWHGAGAGARCWGLACRRRRGDLCCTAEVGECDKEGEEVHGVVSVVWHCDGRGAVA
jgi:hypothetical protein